MKRLLKALYPIYFAIAICAGMAIKSHGQVSGWPYPFSSVNPPQLGNASTNSSLRVFTGGGSCLFQSDGNGRANFTSCGQLAVSGSGIIWNNQADLVEVNAPRAPLNVFVQGPLNAAAAFSYYVATQAMHIRRVSFAEINGAGGCATLPTIQVLVAGVSKYVTPGIPNGSGENDSGLLATPIAVAAGASIQTAVSTLQSGCTAAGSAAINLTMETTTD